MTQDRRSVRVAGVNDAISTLRGWGYNIGNYADCMARFNRLGDQTDWAERVWTARGSTSNSATSALLNGCS